MVEKTMTIAKSSVMTVHLLRIYKRDRNAWMKTDHRGRVRIPSPFFPRTNPLHASDPNGNRDQARYGRGVGYDADPVPTCG